MCDCKPGVPACMSCLRETFPVSRNDMLKARDFAVIAHGDQTYDGKPYLVHMMMVWTDQIDLALLSAIVRILSQAN